MFTAHLITVHSETEDDIVVKAFYEGVPALLAASQLATGDSVAVTHWIGRFPNDITLAEAEDHIRHRLNTGGEMPDNVQRAEVQP